MPDLNFKDTQEFSEYLIKLHADNPKKSIPQLMDILYNNGATVAGKDIGTVEDKNPGWSKKVQDFVVSKESNVSEEDKIDPRDLNPEPDKYSEGMNFFDATKSSDWEEMTGQQKLEALVNDYNSILENAKNLVDTKSSGYGLSGKGADKFQTELNGYKQQLEAIEKSPEFQQLMVDIAKNGTGKLWDNGVMNTNVNQTLKLIASGEGSKMFADKDRLKNWFDSYNTTGFGKFVNEYEESGGWLSSVPFLGAAAGPIASIFAGEDAQDIAKAYVQKRVDEIKKNGGNDTNKTNYTKTQKEFDISSLTDDMKFGDDVSGAGGNDYLSKRNNHLARALKMKGLESPEEINKYLSKYDSWKNAKDEWKKKTLEELSSKVSKMPELYDKSKISSNKKNDKKDDKKNDKKDKEVFDKDAWVWKEDENGNWNPDNDSPINGIEEENEEGGKGKYIEHEEQTPENNKYLYIDETIKNLDNDDERIKYLKKHGFKVGSNGYYEKNGMKTRVYKDGQYNPKWVKGEKKDGYADNVKVSAPRLDEFQIKLQEQGYKGPRNASGDFIPMTDKYLDITEGKKI